MCFIARSNFKTSLPSTAWCPESFCNDLSMKLCYVPYHLPIISYEGSIQLKVRKAVWYLQSWLRVVSSWKCELSCNHSAAANAIKKKAPEIGRFSGCSQVWMHWGNCSQNQICTGSECERKHEVVNQSEEEQNFQRDGNTVLKISFLEKTWRTFLRDGQKRDKKMEKESEETK